MSEMPQFRCELTCPGQAAKDLGAIATQFVPLETWLYDPAQTPGAPVEFSEAATHTVWRYFGTKKGPEDPYYGEQLSGLRTGMELRDLELIHAKVRQEGLDINAQDVSRLQDIAARRQADRAAFASMREEDKVMIGTRTRPFLERLSLIQHERDIYRALPDDLRQELPLHFRTPLEQAYHLDQLPYIVAREALQACGGPMLLIKRRWFGFGSEGLRHICPYGDHDTTDYLRAQYQAYLAEQRNPRPEG